MEVSSKGGAVSLKIKFWWSEKDQAIHITPDDDDAPSSFHVAIRADPAKPSGQPFLFRELTKCLRQVGALAPPDDFSPK